MKGRRDYVMGGRADAVAASRERILDAAFRLWQARHYDAVSLEAVAARAGVTKQTVIRQFGSKERLAVAVVDRAMPHQHLAPRLDRSGDIGAAAAALVDHYEQTGGVRVWLLELERRAPDIDQRLEQGRARHRQWVTQMFARFLRGTRGAARRQRVLAFSAATDVLTWKLLRRDTRCSRDDTQAVFHALIAGVAAGTAQPRRGRRRIRTSSD
jgi:AcrR family transcriptional regulator